MADLAYVKEYFSRHAELWNDGHYNAERWPSTYPIGQRRVEIALEKVVESLATARGHLIDLGCGGGALCAHAARLGFDVVGIDIAEGMLDEARTLATETVSRAASAGERCGCIDLRQADVLHTDLPAAGFDAVTALGLIEYLPADAPFFAEAARLLRTGGVLVVSARNRLFNLSSLNDYTAAEIADGRVGGLMEEVHTTASAAVDDGMLRDFARRLDRSAGQFAAALAADLGERGAAAGRPPEFEQRRRQHSPNELTAAAKTHGFRTVSLVGVHPHPLPPEWERATPRFYNLLASVFEAFTPSAAALRWSSTTVAVFTKC